MPLKAARRTLEVIDLTLTCLQDCIDLLVWSQTQEGLVVSVTADPAGNLVVQAEGFTVPTVQATIGDTICWDGFRFTVESAAKTQPALPSFMAPAIEPPSEGETA